MLYNAIVVIPLVGHAAKRFHLAVVHPGVGSRAVVRKESHSTVADPGGGLRGLKTPPSARPVMNKLTYE